MGEERGAAWPEVSIPVWCYSLLSVLYQLLDRERRVLPCAVWRQLSQEAGLRLPRRPPGWVSRAARKEGPHRLQAVLLYWIWYGSVILTVCVYTPAKIFLLFFLPLFRISSWTKTKQVLTSLCNEHCCVFPRCGCLLGCCRLTGTNQVNMLSINRLLCGLQTRPRWKTNMSYKRKKLEKHQRFKV